MLFFKSKALRAKESQVHEVGQKLFSQVATGREAAQYGRISEEDFNKRINSMFCAGYLIGFVDEQLATMFKDEKSKGKYAAIIFNGIFPRSGVQFVQSKLAARRMGEELKEAGSKRYIDCMTECDQFDNGISSARLEVTTAKVKANYKAHGLADFLISGSTSKDLGM